MGETTAGAADERRQVILFGSEAIPYAKTGGLADVLGSLPSALASCGWDATLVLPRYRGISAGEPVDRFPVIVGGYACEPTIFVEAGTSHVRTVFVDVPDLYDRDALYGVNTDYADSPRRFSVLARAGLEFVARRGRRPAVVHAHDWQGGLVPVYLRTLYSGHPVLGGVPSVFTIHNLAYQGLFPPDWLPRLDLPWNLYSVEQMEYWGRISLLKGGINFADRLTTVSPTYAREIQTSEFGCGFEGILRRRAGDLQGILNGIDTDRWNPASDPYIPAPFSARNLSGKRAAKRATLTRYNLPRTVAGMKRPLIGMISRMIHQKGFDLLAALGDSLLQLDAAFVILGTGEPRYQDFWSSLARRAPERVGVHIGFDEELAHLIEAGADLFLMPSRFEPCGLNQMYSLRYGTVPVVRAVGGLADTVVDAASRGRQNGFVFHPPTPEALLVTLNRALQSFTDRRAWRRIQFTGMQGDYSWHRSAQEYVTMYESLAGV
jgi:starch synthase